MKKSSVIDILNSLPEEFEMEALIEKLLFVEKVEKGLKDVAEGKTITLEDVRKRFSAK